LSWRVVVEPDGMGWEDRWPARRGPGGSARADPADGQVDAAGRHARHRGAGRAQDRRRQQGQGRPGGGGGGGPEAPGGPGAAAGGGPGAVHQTDPAAVADGGHGQADVPSRSPPRGWLDIAKRTAREVKADQVPLLGAGVASYALLSLFPAIIAGVSIYGLVADPQTVRDQIAKLTEMLSPETAKILGQQIQQVTSGAGGALPRRNARC
jgi:membrane protein